MAKPVIVSVAVSGAVQPNTKVTQKNAQASAPTALSNATISQRLTQVKKK